MKYYIVTFSPSDFRDGKQVILATSKDIYRLKSWVIDTYNKLFAGYSVFDISFNPYQKEYWINKDESVVKFIEYDGYMI